MFEQFFAENLFLLVLLFLSIGMFFALPTLASIGGSSAVSALHLPQLQRDKNVVIDVSPAADYKKGHLPGAINAPLDSLIKDDSVLRKHKNKNIIITCATGNKSITAGKHLKRSGYEKVYHLSGGIAAWQKENLPLEN